MEGSDLVRRVQQLCGFSQEQGPAVIRRCLVEIGADPTAATLADLRRCLPRLQARMLAFYPPEEAARRAKQIEKFLEGMAERDDSGDDWSEDETAFGKRRRGGDSQGGDPGSGSRSK